MMGLVRLKYQQCCLVSVPPQVGAHLLYVDGNFLRCRNEGCRLEALRKNRYRYEYVIKGQERYSKCPINQVEHLHKLRMVARAGS